MEGTGVGFMGEGHYQREKNVPDIRYMCCKVPNMSEEQQRPTVQRIMWEQKTGGFRDLGDPQTDRGICSP